MSKIDRLVTRFRDHIETLPPPSSSGSQRVTMVVYDPFDEHALRLRFDQFGRAAQDAGLTWRPLDLTRTVASWIAGHRYRDRYFQKPELMSAGLDDRITSHVAEIIRTELSACAGDARSIVGVTGVGALFGFASIAGVLGRVDREISGRLAVFFPGHFRDGCYRLLDARESWDYHAYPLTAEA